ncbi:non-ribosomal peptide synthetase, partial [Pyxidicoccus caerfyrddinensis]|uniref:non-ribosomal peptide synthetase n=1 Tax=Pyxidicoccus caerfyrddinensis TaxID=2709663 RepID=UPI0013DD6854
MALTPEQKRARLAELLRDKARQSRRAPVSFSQERMWLQERLEPGSAALNIPTAVRLSGALDVDALRGALQELVHRHEALRTTFVEQDGRVLQQLADSRDVSLPVVAVPGGEEEAWRRLHEDAKQPFDLESGPLLRAVLYRWAEREQLLLLNLHHIVSDGWTMGVLVRELGVLYPALATGQPASLPPLPLQYADFAVWQRDWLRGETLDTQLGYWRQRLDPSAVLELPTDRLRAPDASTRGVRHTVMLSPQLLQSLQALARREGRTLFTLLLAAWQVLLSRYSGQDDVVVGAPVAGRNRAELEGLVGLFVNTLALRTDLSGDPSFLELLGRVHETVLGAFAHQDLPFEKVVEALRPERRLGVSPLFQVMFALQNAPLPPMEVPGLRMEAQPVDSGAAQVDLSLLATELPQGLRVAVVYRTDLFDAATVTRLLGHFQTLLEGLAAHPERRLSELPLMDAAELRRVLLEWNGEPVPVPGGACIHDLFEAQARSTPDATALFHGDATLAYGELDARANQLAHHLRMVGVGPDTLVALHLERSVDLIVAMLGVLKAGGAFLPLDPSYPAERLGFMLGDASVPLVITVRSLADVLPSRSERRVLLDEDAAQLARQPRTPPASEVLADHLAYVIYTSGSTGRPKGVAVTHRGVPNLAQAQARAMGIQAGTRVLQFASAGFDAAVSEVFVTLLSGGTLYLPSSEERMPGPALAAMLRTRQINVATLPPTALSVMEPEGLENLRTVISAGEACSAELVAKWAPGRRFINAYGPTEATVCASMAICAPDGQKPSIGGPLANVRFYVLDAHLRPVPTGVPGELFIGGVGLARGYLHRPELTAERFIPDAFSGVPGERLYRTGDLVRWKPDGMLDSLGRTDFQVKLRGFRIELGEIESALRAHPGVGDAVAVVREDGSAGPRLIAYVVTSEDALDIRALRESLSLRLPEFMVPSAFVVLKALPLTPNGKVDRKALPAPDASQTLASAYLAPRTPTETLLADLWAQLLGVPRVGANDNFFELGGHSLLATRVIARLRALFGVELSLRELFSAPTLARLAEQVQKQRLAALQGRVKPLLFARAHTDELPLSFAQQRLWLIDQLQPGSSAYNMPAFVRMEGQLDPEALRRAFHEVVHRHEALRTTFLQREGQPFQRIASHAEVPLEVVELDSEELERQLQEDALRPFDLATGPLLRVRLLKLGPTEHVLALNMHHIVSDGWSMGVLVREVAALYSGASLPPLPVQYADYSAWQRDWLQGEALDAQLGWWKQQLFDAPTLLELPTDRPRPPVPSHRGAWLPVRLPRNLSESLKALSKRHGLTPFMTLLAGFQSLLARYSGQEDIVVGAPIAGRTHAQTEGLIGFFVNSLALRARVDSRASFLALMEQVRHTTLGAYEHQDVPFEKLVEELRPQRSLSHAPLFQVSFTLQNTPMGPLELPGLKLRPLALASLPAKFDLELTLEETPEGFHGGLHHAADLFDASTVARMATHLQSLLAAACEDATRPLASLTLMSAEEERQVLVEWNATARDFPRDTCAHLLFEAQARRTPEATALRFGEEALTYRELDARANQLAHHLRSRGIGPDTLVALHLERSIELVVAIFGVLKAGGAFLPLDPSYPAERLGYMLADASVPLVITVQGLANSLPLGEARRVLLDVDAQLLAKQPQTPPSSTVTAENLAYTLYTSGSTGRPKGVMVMHRGLVHYLHWALREYRVSQGQSAPVHTSVAFDATLTSLLTPLLAGGEVHLLPSTGELEALANSLRQHRHGLVKLTPAHLQVLLDLMLPEELARLEGAFVVGGEALPPATVERWQRLAPRVRLVNEYGPTETVVGCSIYDLNEGGVVNGIVPIGRPIANTALYVLDAQLQPVPVGVIGELFIGGQGVARGYLRRPELTAERFIPDAFSTTPGARMYRTGDRARFLADGNLDFLGRRDGQVKLRGFRIELGEIEAALRAHPNVADAVAVVREDGAAGPRLVAYVVPSAEAVDVRALRESLSQRLPEFMVPSAFAVLQALPLTPNGKVDRKALPAPDSAQPAASGYLAPRTPTETLLADLWAQLLGVPRVGANDNFFELGGHSLLATQVVSRLRSALQVELPLRTLFEAPTVAGLSVRIDASRDSTRRNMPAIVPQPRTGPPLLSFAQQRLWFIDQLEPGSATYNIPAALHLEGALDSKALERALAEVVRRHEALRTTFASRDGQPVQRIHASGGFALVRVDLTHLSPPQREEESQRLAREEALRPFNLATGPLLRGTLLHLDAEAHVLLLDMHHIVSDGWSMGVLVREVAALYSGASLPPLPVQYADYSTWQRDWLQGEVLDAQLGYWKQQLAGAPHVLELPTDRPRPSVPSHRGAHLPVWLPRDLSESLKALSKRQGLTPFMTLLAAFQVLLARYSGQEDIVVGSPIAGRTYSQTEGLIGFFVNTLVLRTHVEPRTTSQELFARVRATTLSAYEHQDVPFEKLVEELRPQRSLSHSPLFQVGFTLQNTPMGPLELPGVKLRPLAPASLPARFDLNLSLEETPEGFRGGFHYAADLFDTGTVARMAAHLQTLLEGIATHPERRLSELPLMDAAERQRVLVEWNATARDFPRGTCAHLLFEAQVQRAPDATALRFANASLTYRELDARANQLAWHLRSLGIGPDSLVALHLERSIELVVAIFGVLKAGGAFLPLDPSYPAERLGYMLSDSAALVVVTTEHLSAVLPSRGERRVLLDADAPLLARQPETLPTSTVTAENLAYVLYTSGSTGRPKGVMVMHRGLVNYLHWALREYRVSQGQSAPVHTSVAFDATLTSLLTPLLAGGEVHLLPSTGELEALADSLRQHRHGLVKLTPAHLQVLLDLMLPEELARLEGAFVVGGEALPPATVERWQRLAPRVRLVNEYGPTETVVGCSIYDLNEGGVVNGIVPIGRPIANTALYVLDAQLQPVP